MIQESFKITKATPENVSKEISRRVDSTPDNIKRIYLEFGSKVDVSTQKPIEEAVKKEIDYIPVTASRSDRKKNTYVTIFAEKKN